jgi:hypothetical protein
MPESGGPAAIYGFLYQILANLWRVSEIRLKAKLDGQEIRSARLILEPKGGGDTRYEGDGIRVVEQYKTRGGNRTWSLKELIEGVLRNLFLDLDDLDPNWHTGPGKYRFVTDGRCGESIHSPNFQQFLQSFKSKLAPKDLLGSLDNTRKYPFFTRGNLTDRDLLLHIAKKVRPRRDQTEDAIHHRKVWHLLAGFEFDEQMSASDLTQAIDRALIELVDGNEDVEAKRRELCTILMELAAQGNVTCTPRAILDRAQLNVTPLSDIGTLKMKLWEKAEEASEGERYDKGKDVRRVPNWPNEYPVLVVAGESGQGKTWQLLNLMDSILTSGGLAVFVLASGDAERDLPEASDAVWLEGFVRVQGAE